MIKPKRKLLNESLLEKMYWRGCYFVRYGTLEEAERMFRMAARHGHHSSQMELAEGYYVEGKINKAKYWYEKVSRSRSSNVKFYRDGKSFKLKRKNENKCNKAGALFQLGIINVKENQETLAKHYFEKAASLGHAEACYKLALIYADGKIVDKDVKKSFYFYKKAADLGHVESCFSLGLYYYSGAEVEKNDKKALQSLRAMERRRRKASSPR